MKSKILKVFVLMSAVMLMVTGCGKKKKDEKQTTPQSEVNQNQTTGEANLKQEEGNLTSSTNVPGEGVGELKGEGGSEKSKSNLKDSKKSSPDDEKFDNEKGRKRSKSVTQKNVKTSPSKGLKKSKSDTNLLVLDPKKDQAQHEKNAKMLENLLKKMEEAKQKPAGQQQVANTPQTPGQQQGTNTPQTPAQQQQGTTTPQTPANGKQPVANVANQSPQQQTAQPQRN